VLTPSYGYGRFIADCIESVIVQEGVRTEHVVQDGGSRDETLDVLRSFGEGVSWRSEPDDGQSDALNKALERATGRWVAWLNADEFYLPRSLHTLITEGDRHGADVVFGDSVTVDRDGKMLGLRPQHSFSPSILRLYGPFPASVSMIVRREALGTAPWDRLLRIVMDWDLYLRLLAQAASFHHVNYPVGAFRMHEDQVSAGPGSKETTVVRQRYKIPTAKPYRRMGRVLHRARKLAGGSYVRQVRGNRFRGRDLRWFRDDVGTGAFFDLLTRCYGRSVNGTQPREGR
jgi:glycosyltransferase involved in cell wall biosynthesis